MSAVGSADFEMQIEQQRMRAAAEEVGRLKQLLEEERERSSKKDAKIEELEAILAAVSQQAGEEVEQAQVQAS